MKVFGRATVNEFLNDRIVYRNLAPLDGRLPALDEIRGELGLPPRQIPRKSEPDYGRLIVHFLKLARSFEAPGTAIRRLIFIGDTHLLDATAFDNICNLGGWPGLAFIGAETAQPLKIEVVPSAGGQTVFLSNRWSALGGEGERSFARFCSEQGFPIDEATALVVDLDKTAIGARGRNAEVIDQARVQAVYDTVSSLLGATFDQKAFRSAYDQLNQFEFHPFTADNQDYLAYICLILGGGLYDLEGLVESVRRKNMQTFRQFIDVVESRKTELPSSLAGIHAEIYANVLIDDPTPFKPFRRNEYLNTVGRMGCLDDATPVEQLLRGEIVITQEVRLLALDWQKRGALLFCLSDKPDEASIPTPELAAQGHAPIHRTLTHVVGE